MALRETPPVPPREGDKSEPLPELTAGRATADRARISDLPPHRRAAPLGIACGFLGINLRYDTLPGWFARRGPFPDRQARRVASATSRPAPSVDEAGSACSKEIFWMTKISSCKTPNR